MSRILIGGAGGAPSEGVIQSLLEDEKHEEIIGMGSEPFDLILSSTEKKLCIPYAVTNGYKNKLCKILVDEKIDFLHCQNDVEIFEVSKIRDDIKSLGVSLYLPEHDVVDICVNKFKSYEKWASEGIPVPRNIFINNEQDLKRAFDQLEDNEGNVWIRSASIGGGGKGALPTNDFEFAKRWINRYDGWGSFSAAEILTSQTVTWLSIWYEGELVVAQTRKRIGGWIHGSRTLSGVTGVTKVGITLSDENINSTATSAILSIDKKPNGIYGVDMTYDKKGIPKPTEINIARFFTTILFFTKAGLNMPKIYKDIALYNEFPSLNKKINPLPDGLMWVRGMDTEPILITEEYLRQNLKGFEVE
jgi:carbamoyl-phosphate synthase large subunit